MNFLAHAFLSGGDPDILLGNLMADFLTAGESVAHQNAGVQRGIAWHYQIDRFMDSHPLVAQSRGRLFLKYRHYSAVLVDVVYDHLLAKNWESFSAVSLGEFASWVYQSLQARAEKCPPRMANVLPHLIADDWLCSYEREDGVLRALTRLGQRGTRGVDLVAAWADFSANYALYETEFSEFFPQIVTLGNIVVPKFD